MGSSCLDTKVSCIVIGARPEIQKLKCKAKNIARAHLLFDTDVICLE